MKNKKVLIIIFILLAALLIVGGAIYTLKGNDQPKKEKEEVLQKKPKVEIDQEAADHEVGKMKSITTPDKKIRFGTTTLYRYDDISGMIIYSVYSNGYTEQVPNSHLEIVNGTNLQEGQTRC